MRRLLSIGLVVVFVSLAVFAGYSLTSGSTEGGPTGATAEDLPDTGLSDEATVRNNSASNGGEDSSASGTHRTGTPGEYDGLDGTNASLLTDGLVLHLESDTGVTVEDGSVTGWADQSGQGNHLTATGDPSLRRGVLNGHAVISFDGRDDFLNRSTPLHGLPKNDEDRTMYVVARFDGLGSGGVGYGRQFGGGNHAFQLVVDEDGLLELNAFGKSNDFITPINGTERGWMIRSIVLRNDTFAHYMNGTRYDTGTHRFDTKLDHIVVGAEIDYDPRVEMQVASMLVYDRALNATERRTVEAYLQRTYVPEIGADANTPPTANPDFVTVRNGSAVEIDVLANDDDPDGTLDSESVVAAKRSRGHRGPMYGRVSVDETTGTITYNHVGSCRIGFYSCGSNENDSFTYTVLDDDGEPSNVATVFVNVTSTQTTNALSLDSAVALIGRRSAGAAHSALTNAVLSGVSAAVFLVTVTTYTRVRTD